MAKFKIVICETIYYEPIEVEADGLEEAEALALAAERQEVASVTEDTSEE